jgi:hypothetical protein
MNSQIKQKWIDALESGEYPQTSEFLRTEQGYCCLGVLCNIYAKEKNNDEVQLNLWEQFNDNYEILGEGLILPVEVKEWAGLDDTDVYYTDEDDEKVYLAVLNDSGMSFNQIAQVIKENI